jgi:hypothetical protein
MNAIEKIKAKLSAYSDARYSEGPEQIEVHPRDPSGFTVVLRIARPGFTVYFERWHEEFTSEDEALNCFAFGLSPKCRLAVVLRGKHRNQVGRREYRERTVEGTLENGSAPPAFLAVGSGRVPSESRARCRRYCGFANGRVSQHRRVSEALRDGRCPRRLFHRPSGTQSRVLDSVRPV